MANQKSDKNTKPLGRREFILGAGAGAAAVGAALVVSKVEPQEVAKASPSAEPGQEGYRLTEHISNYYRTARV
ncbi:MAG: twin-arginine translocation signal domain-containing protein [Burkholderiales bacterium]|nr:twin-arginine translocation signal domain-containing protein [Burkholderiales bacterium]